MSAPVGVLAVLDDLIADMGDTPGTTGHQVAQVRAAVAELVKCCDVTVKAFEALGRTDNFVAQIESHRECERALIEQKAAIRRAQGCQP